MYAKLNTTIEIPVIDRYGYSLDTRSLRNSPLAELYPGEPVAMIQWVGDDRRPSLEEIMAPVSYKDVEYYGHLAWGSAVKRGQTIGVTRDFPVGDGLVQVNEDGQRVQRWLLASGIFGGFKGDLKIGIFQPGERVGPHPVEDGFGYIKRSLVKKYGRPERVELGAARDNYTFWQRLDWDKIKDEIAPLARQMAAEAADPRKMLPSMGHSYETKKELYELEPQMIEHPFVAASLNRAAKDYFLRACTGVNLGGVFRTAVPTTSETIVCPGFHGRLLVDRSPIDSNGSIQAVTASEDPEEEARILGLEVVQVSISSKKFMSKGCLGVIDDELMDYDIIVCSEDIKMVSSEIGTLKDVRRLAELTVEDAVVPFLMIWDGKSLCGVNARWAKTRMGLDHDGDGVRVTDVNHLPDLWLAVATLEPGETPKLPKSKTPVSEQGRAEMILKSMTNLVGMATNVTASTFMVHDRRLLARQLGMTGVEAMDNRCNYWIKVGTDGFKTSVDQVEVESQIAAVQNAIKALFGTLAPWTHWARSQWAFARCLPPIIEDTMWAGEEKDGVTAGETLFKVGGEWKTLEDELLRIAILPFMDGTVAQIARETIPYLSPHWSQVVEMKTLTAFRAWVPEPADEMKDQAEEIQFWFNARVGRVNWTDPKDIQAFKIAYKERLEEWQGDPWVQACALWWVAHSSRGKDATAASVFFGFPEEARKIVSEKPGDKVTNVIVVGLKYQLPRFVQGEIEGIRIEEWVQEKNGKRLVRSVICGKAPGQVAPRDPRMPKDLLAFIAENANQPKAGAYSRLILKPMRDSYAGVLVE